MPQAKRKNNNDLNIFFIRYVDIALALALVVFLAVGYLIFLRPKFEATMASVQSGIADEQRIYAQEQAKLTDLRAMAELYKKINPSDLDKFNNFLPGMYAPERLYGEIEEIVTRQGLILSNISYIPSDGTTNSNLPPSVHRVSLSLSLGAVDYRGLKTLLGALETNLRLFDVTSLDFNPATATAKLQMDTYYYQP